MQPTITITHEGVICDVNAAAQKLLRTNGSLVGKHLSQCLHDSDQAREAIKALVAGKVSKDLRISFKLEDGLPINVCCNRSIVNTKPNGSIKSIAISFDLHTPTEPEWCEGIVNGANDAIFSADCTGTIVMWNFAAGVLFGRSAEQTIGTSLASLFACEQNDIDRLIRMILEATKIKQVELTRQSGGQTRVVLIEFSPILSSSNERMGISAVCHDVTEDKMQLQNVAGELKKIVQTNRMLTDHASELSRLAMQMELFAEMAGLLQVCESEEELFFLICRIAAKLYPRSSGSFHSLAPATETMMPSGFWGGANYREYGRRDCLAARRAEPYVTTTPGQGEERCRHITEMHGTYLCVPMLLRQELVGVLTVHWESSDISSDSTASATRLLGDSALAVSNLRLRQELQELAIRDELTGLYNRRQMQEFLKREIVRTSRKRTPLSVIMFDVDHFKRFNDKHGHRAGDAVLREIGKLTQTLIRVSDIGCRYGGEEFLIILPETHVDIALQKAEALRSSAQGMQIKLEEVELPAVSLSLGVASFPMHAGSAEALIQHVDTALYSAKQLGRNRVVMAAPEELNDDWVEPS